MRPLPGAANDEPDQPVGTHYNLQVFDTIAGIAPDVWDGLVEHTNPFLRHAFLGALETHGCANEFGWFPQHLALTKANGELQAVMPLYAKTNSYGEFVFDGQLAAAYMQYGREYYPKLVCAIPYTPVCGQRLTGNEALKHRLIQGAMRLADTGYSGVHWLFCTNADLRVLRKYRVAVRNDVQFHWHNPGYGNFDDFLGALKSKKRKMIRRERRIVEDSSLHCVRFTGSDMPESMWASIHQMYRNIFEEKSGVPTFNEAFFRAAGRTIGDDFIVFAALDGSRPVACAITYRNGNALYGRHWGCDERHRNLHFELCYYMGIEYCIEHGLRRFEPGAQGEHKIARGFLPTITQSAHWLNDAVFADALEHFCERERLLIREYADTLRTGHNPYREDSTPTPGDTSPEANHVSP